jgi:RNA polymerase sigma-70 factor (ECF subfamily)
MKKSPKNQRIKINDRIMKRVADKDAAAFEELYNISSSAVFGLAYSIVANQADAEDVVQEVYISIYEKAHQYQSRGKAMAWIFTITRNHSLMRIRDRQKRNYKNLDDIHNIGVENNIENEMYNEKVIKTILNILNEDERQIVVMHSMSNMKHKDIATTMEMPISTVLSKYKRALSKLRNELEVNGYEK